MRLFVESILRYGLPPQFLAALMKPVPKTAVKLRKVLAQSFGGSGARSASCLCASLELETAQDGAQV